MLDFEFLLAGDDALPAEELRERDRAIFVEKIAPTLSQESADDRRAVLRAWVAERRRRATDELPGEQFITGWQTLLTLAVLGGLLLGGGLTMQLLRYSGAEPLNALVFLASTLGPQWLLIFAALLFWIERRTTRFLTDWRPLRALLAGLVALFGAGARRLHGESRVRLQAAIGRLAGKSEIYGSMATWPLLVVTQIFAVSFNVAILAMLLAQLPARELRFGWQTTWGAPEQVARVVGVLAAPWAWAPNSHPSTQEVFDTKYAPGQAHKTLPGAAMRAWWPFLFYAVACYGLVVRVAFLILAAVKMRRSLAALTFNHADANALWRRLSGPSVTTQPTGNLQVPEVTNVPPIHSGVAGDCLALVADEVAQPVQEMAAELASRFRWRLGETLPVKIDNRRACADQLARLRETAPSLAGVVITIPAARDPIVAIALFIREVISAAGAKPEVLILLLADKSQTETALRVKYWRDLLAIHRLHVGLETLCHK